MYNKKKQMQLNSCFFAIKFLHLLKLIITAKLMFFAFLDRLGGHLVFILQTTCWEVNL